jgi:outer membrane protein
MAMRNPFGALGLALLGFMAQSAAAVDLVDAWRAAVQNDKDYAVGRVTQATAQPRRDQASALWRPSVGLTAAVGIASNDTETRGAQFSAPGFGQSSGVGFNTSVNNGNSGRWAIVATQPLYNPERRAQQRQLNLSADAAEVEWQAASQSLMSRTAERYFDLAVAEETVRVLRLQLDAVQAATIEAQDRFKLGSTPVTDTYEARARLASVRAQVLAAESELQIKRSLLADSTGLPLTTLAARLPARPNPSVSSGVMARPLESWLADAQSGNPLIRGQLLAVEVASQEASKYSRGSSATVDLVAHAGRDRLSGSGDFGSAGNTGSNRMIGIQLSVPLFTGGYRDARAEEALRLAEKATAEVERTRQQVSQQVQAAWLGLSVGAQRVQSLDEALAASAARRDATQLGREVGQRTTLDVLNAENDFATAQLALTQGRVGLLMDRLRLAALAGQLDESTLQSVNGELSPAESRTQAMPVVQLGVAVADAPGAARPRQ